MKFHKLQYTGSLKHCLLTQMFPPEGITVFGSLLHTHLAGK